MLQFPGRPSWASCLQPHLAWSLRALRPWAGSQRPPRATELHPDAVGQAKGPDFAQAARPAPPWEQKGESERVTRPGVVISFQRGDDRRSEGSPSIASPSGQNPGPTRSAESTGGRRSSVETAPKALPLPLPVTLRTWPLPARKPGTSWDPPGPASRGRRSRCCVRLSSAGKVWKRRAISAHCSPRCLKAGHGRADW